VSKGRWQVSTGGGRSAVWARNSREIFYAVGAPGQPRQIMAVPIESGPSFRWGNPQVVVKAADVWPSPARPYDVSPDGRRFLMIKNAAPAAAAPARPQLVVVENWIEELKRLVPVD
jgi:hypothetical protein